MQAMNGQSIVLYKETQRFTQWWLWVLILVPVALTWYGTYLQLILKKPFGNHPAPDSVMLIIWIIFGIGLPLLFIKVRLETEVRYKGLYVRFSPFQFKFRAILYDNIESYEIRTYSGLKEYGGYGIRYGTQGKAYNVSGNQGMQLKLKKGKDFLVGTQDPVQFFNALDSAIKSYKRSI
jgi:hypothetical protein